MNVRAASLWSLHPDYAADETTALEQFIFEHLHTKTAQLLASPDAWYCEVETPDRVALCAAYKAGDIHEIGRIVTRVSYNMAEDEARRRLEEEFRSIRRG